MKKLDQFINNKKSKYYYNFDYIMHDFILKEFKKKIVKGKCLELGAGFGNFTELLSKIFKDLTVVEGSDKSIKELKKKKIKKILIIKQNLEKLNINEKFNNIFIIHTYEHLKNRIKFLKNLRNILEKNGKIFLVCPNANAASRQIAVKMNLIKKETSVTETEKEHGHFVTHNLKTLKAEVKRSGLYIDEFGGICFKPLANFQLDDAVKKKIINKEFLEGCFKLGKKYPELCSSIYLIAKIASKFK
jgi:2-polyprenyl-3-methyl-5-hydroxy-6-metoxy-1,4-benzoquinol methylase